MGAKLDALVRSFLRSDGDALYLVPGERIFMMKGTGRAVVGREPLSAESFEAVAGELVPGQTSADLAEKRHRMEYQLDPTSGFVDLQFGFIKAHPSLVISRLPSPEAIEQARLATQAPSTAFRLAEAAFGEQPSTAFSREEGRSGGTARLDALALAAEPLPERPAGPLKILPPGLSSAAGMGAARTPARLSLEDVLLRMLDLDAFEAHLASSCRPAYRVNGEIVFQEDMPLLSSLDVERLLSGVMTQKAKSELGSRLDLELSFEVEGTARFGVLVYRDRNGLGAVLKQAPCRIRTAEELLVPAPAARLAECADGLVLVTGPAGSGKSMTLAALVERIVRTRPVHVVTLEEPIEFLQPPGKALVNQREVGTHTRDLLEGLKAALKEDADVVVVGSLRDPEVFATALSGADGGRLVLGGLELPSAVRTVERLVDQFPADRQPAVRLLLAESLRGVVSQVLCRRVGGGRVPAHEVLLGTPSVRSVIREGKSYQLQGVIQASRGEGMQSLTDALLELVKAGVVEPREAWLKANDRQAAAAGLRALGVVFQPDSAG